MHCIFLILGNDPFFLKGEVSPSILLPKVGNEGEVLSIQGMESWETMLLKQVAS